jgi:hypothetical protein
MGYWQTFLYIWYFDWRHFLYIYKKKNRNCLLFFKPKGLKISKQFLFFFTVWGKTIPSVKKPESYDTKLTKVTLIRTKISVLLYLWLNSFCDRLRRGFKVGNYAKKSFHILRLSELLPSDVRYCFLVCFPGQFQSYYSNFWDKLNKLTVW